MAVGEPERLERERAFHDHRYEHGSRERADKFYAVTRRSGEHYRSLLAGYGPGSRVLEYGCGTGSMAFELGERGADVLGIDISPVAIEEATAEAAARGLGDRVRFRAMDAEALDAGDGTFDLVCGSGILHHLDVRAALAELTRCLKPGGRAAFFEPLGHNPVINLYRRLTPGMRSPDEHPLRTDDLDLVARHFAETDFRFFHLLSLAAVAARRSRHFPRVVASLDRLDEALFRRVPAAERFAWTVVLDCRRPVRPGD